MQLMASNLACVGLAVSDEAELDRLARALIPKATRLGHVGMTEVARWEDPSGARLCFTLEKGRLVSLLPSFASDSVTRLARVTRANADVVTAAVVDGDDQQLTSVSFELEQGPLLPDRPMTSGMATLTFLGRDVSVHADPEAFGRSRASLLDPDADTQEPPPAHDVDRGLAWPVRVASEFFLSYGVFGDPEQADATARFSGIVLRADRRTVRETRQHFVVATVRTVGIDVTVCLDGTEFDRVPQPGQVLAGECFVVGSLTALERARTARRWWHRRRPMAQ